MSVLLFGARGQVGSRLAKRLSAAGYECTGIDRARCDFANATARDIDILIEAVSPEIIINCAAYVAVDAAEKEQALAHRVNGAMPEIIAKAAEARGIKLLHCSTDYVFDGRRGAPYRADAVTNPINAYGASKLAGEEAVAAHGGHNFRLQFVYTPGGANFFSTVKKLMGQRDEISVIADQMSAPSHASHVADAMALAVPNILDGTIPASIYHLSAGGYTSRHGFACAIAAAMGKNMRIHPVTSEEYAQDAMRPKDTRLDCSALAGYGISMPHWREGLVLAMENPDAD